MIVKLPKLAAQKRLVKELEKKRSENRSLKIEVCLLNERNLKRFSEGFEQPEPHKLRSIINRIGMSRAGAAEFLGIEPRQLRRYLNEPPDTLIPYAAFRLLLHKIDLIDPQIISVPDGLELPEQVLKEFADGYEPPTAEQLKAMTSSMGLSIRGTAELLGVTDRTVKKWRATDKAISYGCWRLLLVESGVVTA